VTCIKAGVAVACFVVSVASTAHAEGETADEEPNTPDQEVDRTGVHFQVLFGWGGGPTSNGLLHNMELGGTLPWGGITICYQHAFIYSDGFAKPAGGSDLWGGHFLMVKVPVLTPQVVAKVGFGAGENVDRSDGFDATFGVGGTLGVDVHIPMWDTSGLTFSAMVLAAHTPDVGRQFGGGAGFGYTWF